MTDLNALPLAPSESLRGWLLASELSPHLRQHVQHLSLEVLEENWQSPFEDEMIFFNNPNKTWIRKIVILGDGQLCSYGRTVIPLATFERFELSLKTLGTRFIGEHILYNNSQVKRGPFEYSLQSKENILIKEINEILNQNHEALWCRRSMFQIEGFMLLLTEAFFPTLCSYPIVK